MKSSLLAMLPALVVSCTCSKKPEPAWKTDLDKSMAEFRSRKIYDDLSRETLAEIPDGKLEQAVVDLVVRRIERAKGQAEHEVVAGLPGGFLAVYSTWVVEAEVNNGGFNQLFWNSSGRLAKDAVAGFDRMGLTEIAQLVDRAIATYRKDAARLEKLKGEGTLEAFSRSYDQSPYEALDKEFYARSKEVSPARIAFIRGHPEVFVTRQGPAK